MDGVWQGPLRNKWRLLLRFVGILSIVSLVQYAQFFSERLSGRDEPVSHRRLASMAGSTAPPKSSDGVYSSMKSMSYLWTYSKPPRRSNPMLPGIESGPRQMSGGDLSPEDRRQLTNGNDDYFSEPSAIGEGGGPSVVINMMRRANDRVDDSEVPFILEAPHTSTETIYSVLTQCYGLVGKRFQQPADLIKAKQTNIVDNFYVNAHNRPMDMFQKFGDRFHFISTPHYQEGMSLFTPRHKGRVFVMIRHPAIIAESMYLTRPGSVKGDMKGLLAYVNSTDYYDNWMTRMLANVDKNVQVTEEHFKQARSILENKFLVGVTQDMAETVLKRIKIYFGWKELPDQAGCELDLIKRGSLDLPPTSLTEGGIEWRKIVKRNHFDMKLYARGLAVFGLQKMRLPIHSLVVQSERQIAQDAFAHLRNVNDPRQQTDIPFFWHIPKASGTTVKETLSDCYGLVRTEMVKPPSSLEIVGENILNVDLSTPEAVEAAIQSEVADKNLADVFVSQLSLEGSTVFTPTHYGRAFTIMRHPVKLAASLFYYRQIATWEPTYRPDFKEVTLGEYVQRSGYYDNWMVRMLTNAKLGGLNEGHLELAKSILKDKFLVGISDHMDETFRQLELYYGWKETKKGCVDYHLHSAPSNKNKYPVTERGGTEWTLIAEKNKFDMALYYFALELFGDQSERMFRHEKIIA